MKTIAELEADCARWRLILQQTQAKIVWYQEAYRLWMAGLQQTEDRLRDATEQEAQEMENRP